MADCSWPVARDCDGSLSAISYSLSASSDPPERAVSSKLGNFTRRFLADVNADADDSGEGTDENEGHQPRRDVADPERPVEGGRIFNRGSSVEENFRYPRDHDQNEDENVIAFQS